MPTHTVVFKVIGCTKETQYQNILEQCRDLLEDGHSVCVKLSPEPDNVFDPKAIAFLCEVDNKSQRIGYVVKEVQDAVHAALIVNDITNVSFKWIKYITDWYRCGPGFFAGVYVTKRGAWPSIVVRAKSTKYRRVSLHTEPIHSFIIYHCKRLSANCNYHYFIILFIGCSVLYKL